LALLASAACPLVSAQDTFSICAVDTATGQVGSAGATCITSSSVSAIIISDVHPGTGVVHTQAYWQAANQNYGHALMAAGLPPQQIIDSLVAHDVQGNPTIRQYGAVTLAGPLSACHTGANCDNYKSHIAGPGYAIQGNILLGQSVLDSMQAAFLNTTGSLACRLMAALQAAKVPGADTRCLQYGISSYSAFLRVANAGDPSSNLFLDMTVNTYPGNKDPIDSLQAMFDAWGGCTASFVQSPAGPEWMRVFPNPAGTTLTAVFGERADRLAVFDLSGRMLFSVPPEGRYTTNLDITALPAGTYLLRTDFPGGRFLTARFVRQ